MLQVKYIPQDLLFGVYEASEQIGGRTKSVKLSDSITVNLGANWLAGQNNVLKKYVETRKDTFSEDQEKLAIKVLDGSFKDITTEYISLSESYIMALDSLETSLHDDSPFISIEEALSNKEIKYPNSYLKSAVEFLAGNESYSGHSDAMSSQGDLIVDAIARKTNGDEYDLIVDDTSKIVNGIASQADFSLENVNLNQKCVSIQYNEEIGNYFIDFDSKKKVIAKSVIITVPIAQLQKRKIEMNFIPESKWNLIDKLPTAHFANVFVLLEETIAFDENTWYIPTFDTDDLVQPFRTVRMDRYIHKTFGKTLLHFMTVGENAKKGFEFFTVRT